MSNIALRPVLAPRPWPIARPFVASLRRGRGLVVAVPTAAEIYRLIEASCLLGALGLSFGLLGAFLWMGL
jgi:hypothetical protein